MQTQSAFNTIRLGHNHGYRIDNDTVALNADLAIANDITTAQPNWALQLWACDEPYAGGPLFGIKVAEAAVQLPVGVDATEQRLDAQTVAIMPAGQRDYSMVLVLASGQPGAYQVHDFANYPARERFVGPELQGSVGYAIDGDQIVISAERVFNARTPANLSGSLTLELWALPAPHVGGGFEGTQLAQVDLGRVSGQEGLDGLEYRVPFNAPLAGNWHVALMLREWTANAGYITRDFCNFAATYQREENTQLPAAPVVLNELALAPIAETIVPAVAEATVAELVAASPAPTAPVKVEAPVAAPVKTEPFKAVANVETASPVKAEPTEVVPAKIVAARVEAPVAAKVEAPVAAKVEPKVEAPVAAKVEPKVEVPVAAKVEPKVEVPVAAKVEPKVEVPVAAKAPSAAPTAAGRVSLMRGTIEELAEVKGLNRKLAAEIIKARPFTSVDDLARVRGIGDRMLQTLRAYITL